MGYVEMSKRQEAMSLTSFSDNRRTPAIFVKWCIVPKSSVCSNNSRGRSRLARTLPVYFLCFKAPGLDARATSIEMIHGEARFDLFCPNVPKKLGLCGRILHWIQARREKRAMESMDDSTVVVRE
eukprot:IDg8745t1